MPELIKHLHLWGVFNTLSAYLILENVFLQPLTYQ